MAKASGLAQALYIGGYDLSNDIGELSRVGGGNAPIDVTGIDKSAHERIGGLRDGALEYTAFFNDAAARAHPVLSVITAADVIALYQMSPAAIGAQAAGIVGLRMDYAGTRGADGSLQFAIPHPANGYSLEFCELLTAGLRTDTSGTNGASLDGLASSSTGWSAFLQVTALTGTNVVVTLEDSADNAAFAVFTGSAFASATALGAQRINGAAGATVRRYVRAVTSGTFTSASFVVGFTRVPG